MDFILLSLVSLLVCYHIAEYIVHKTIHPEITDKRSFLITWQYLIAFFVGIIEYLLECIYFYDFKHSWTNPMIWIGVLLIVVGLDFRFGAMIHAGKSFTHQISRIKRSDHRLVTDGIYKYIRHPGYLGFLLFAIGTQVYLSNVISPIAFAITLWIFFYYRIIDEEHLLLSFFGEEYAQYRSKTPTYIPFIP